MSAQTGVRLQAGADRPGPRPGGVHGRPELAGGLGSRGSGGPQALGAGVEGLSGAPGLWGLFTQKGPDRVWQDRAVF